MKRIEQNYKEISYYQFDCKLYRTTNNLTSDPNLFVDIRLIKSEDSTLIGTALAANKDKENCIVKKLFVAIPTICEHKYHPLVLLT